MAREEGEKALVNNFRQRYVKRFIRSIVRKIEFAALGRAGKFQGTENFLTECLESDWQNVKDFLLGFKEKLSPSNQIAGGFVAIEAYKNSTLRNKIKGENMKAVPPRILMCLWFYSCNPASPVKELMKKLQQMELGVRVRECNKTPEDTLQCFTL